jgi:selenocysteine lyase/cysteine desulfurase
MLSAAPPGVETVFDELRRREFSRLDLHHQAYLDYTGSALYGESQLRAHREILDAGLFGNPHSESNPSRASSALIDGARRELLEFLDVDSSTHEVCFTANATAAIKLVAESYPFTPESTLLLSVDNHNSVNGIREYARRAEAQVRYLPLDRSLRLYEPERRIAEGARGGGLLAFPAQSNFSGVRHPLGLVDLARSFGLDTLIDIAAMAPTHAVSLRQCPADFAALSFYKLFGYPTGIGALIARRDALARLHRPWFSGGTVRYVAVEADTHRMRPGAEGFEDGTADFLGIAALPAGFKLLREVGMPRLTAHVAALTAMFLGEVVALKHGNGRPLVRIYGPTDMTERGGTVAFNLEDDRGEAIPYDVVDARARDAGVSMRGGCFCNPGASEAAFGLEAPQIATCLDSLGDDFTIDRFATCTGTAVGALRVSVGLANNASDIRRAIDVLASFRT